MKPLSIIIPIYNEELILEKEIVSIAVKMAELLPDLDYELLLVENGSVDRTPQIAQKIAETNSKTRVLSLSIASYGKAIKEGVFNSEAEFLTIFNIDFWDIEFIKKSLPFLKSGYDIVVASKTMEGSKDSRPLLRRFITKFFNIFLRFFFGFKGSDTHGIKMFNRAKIIPVLKQCKTDREIFDTELLLRVQKAGLSKKEIPVSCEEKRKSTKSLLRRVPRTLIDLLILFREFYS